MPNKQKQNSNQRSVKRQMIPNAQTTEASGKIEELPSKDKEMVIEKTIHSSYSGPLPPPQHFEAYEKVCPGSASRILEIAENQQRHRTEIEKALVNANIKETKRGQWFGFAIAFTAIIGGFWLISIDKDAMGIATVIGAIATLVGTYIYGRISEKKERE